eukprot:scaffold26507_cov112-Isochrysis_galbana.AAC.2
MGGGDYIIPGSGWWGVQPELTSGRLGGNDTGFLGGWGLALPPTGSQTEVLIWACGGRTMYCSSVRLGRSTAPKSTPS